jgi:hypothetical protein
MGERLTEERGVLGELARMLADGSHDVDDLLARASVQLERRYSLDAVVVLRASELEAGDGVPPALAQAAATRCALVAASTTTQEAPHGGAAVVVVPITGREVHSFIVGSTSHDGEPTVAELRALTSFGAILGAVVELAERCTGLD